jgi:hypothetical protein
VIPDLSVDSRTLRQLLQCAGRHYVSPMRAPFKEYELVRVRQLIQSADDLDGWRLNLRAPTPGDVGTVLGVLTAPGFPNKYVVECSGNDGISIWLADFFEEEIERV